MKIGDEVRTLAGDSIKGSFGVGKIVSFYMWSVWRAASVQTPDGKIHRNCLVQNLVPAKEWQDILKWRETIIET